MKGYFAYIRVSTVRQGEKGSSLQEQKRAIEAYARRQGLSICQWFEERETAAKRGRTVFTQMMRALDHGEARGVITHKIDRSARNLRDWAALGELLDHGVELHFAHESIDLSSRGGRLSADIQAVVAADYIRNLREEVRKGFYGRLRQGLYPIRAPIGYLDRGRGQPKEIDPVRGPLVAMAFELYATGRWTLDTLGVELHARGLRNLAQGPVTRNGWSTILNNPFYIGLIRIRRTGEFFQGVHPPLISKEAFDQVRAVLQGRVALRPSRHQFRYQRMLRCASCDHALTAERQKGHVYYRCHSRECRATSVRQEAVDGTIADQVRPFELTPDEWDQVRNDIDKVLSYRKTDVASEMRALQVNISAVDSRLGRLTDAYVDRLIERDLYLERKEKLLGERTGLLSRKAAMESGTDDIRRHAHRIFELAQSLGNKANLANEPRIREILKTTTSNLTVERKNVAIAWRIPFRELAKRESVPVCDQRRYGLRTERAQRVAEIIVNHCLRDNERQDEPPSSFPMAA